MKSLKIIEVVGLTFLISFTLIGTITLALMSENGIVWIEQNSILRIVEIFGGVLGIVIASKIMLKTIW